VRGDLLRFAASVLIAGLLATSCETSVAEASVQGVEGRLLEVTLGLQRSADSVTVQADYRFDPGTGALGLAAIRLRKQGLRVLSTGTAGGRAPAGLTSETRAGLWGLKMDRSSLVRGTLSLRYRVYGRPDRVPVFVPTVPTDPLESQVTILVRGYPAGIEPGETFPRLEPAPGSVLATHTTELPGLVHIGRAIGGLTIGAAANVAVVLLILAGLGLWLLLRLRIARGSRPLRDRTGARAAASPGNRQSP